MAPKPSSKHSLPDFPLGIYEHYKGQRYLALTLARLESDLTPVVVYVALYQNDESPSQTWVRTIEDFTAEVEVGGQPRARFHYLGPSIG